MLDQVRSEVLKWSNVSFITKRIKIDGQITMDGRYVSGTKADNLGVEKQRLMIELYNTY